MNWTHPHVLAKRAGIAGWAVLAVLGVIGAAFFRLQVLGDDRYEFQSRQNRLRPVTLPAPRGLIVDRHGEVLADNIPSFTISLLVPDQEALASTLATVARLSGLDSAAIQAVMDRHRRAPDSPVVVMRDAPFDVVSALEERRLAIPGLVVQTEPKRRYPYANAVAHVVGYVNEITEPELAANTIEGARFGALVGRTGLEQTYDERLRGQDGQRFIEVDARGRTVREDPAVEGLDPDPGEVIRTTLDIDLQQYVIDEFPAGSRGAVVALDPRNGDIVAMHSAPTFDPNEFVGGIDPDLWNQWRTDPERPLLNRAVQGRYPPASPWKLAVAAMALRRGVASLGTKMPLECHGGMQYYNRYFRCWKTEGHGDLTMAEAIAHSCDVYFYQLGLRLGLTDVLTDAVGLGFREKTGIDLPGEISPVFPDSRDYFDRLYGPRGWTQAVTLNLAIGQGENAQTVVNMVRFYAMLAGTDGRAPQPRLVSDVATSRPANPSLRLPLDEILGLRRALVTVVESGTAVRSRIHALQIAGKTGTAQNPHGPDHGWFVAFAPADNPEIVVGAIVEHAEHGSAVAPMVTKVIARHLLGVDAVPDRGIELQVPADSAPAPVLIDPDSIIRGPVGGDGR